MLNFLKRFASFGFLLLACATASRGLNQLLMPRHLASHATGARIVVAGDSHVARAINPGMLPSAVNLAQEAEPFTATYHKLVTLLSPRTEIVVIGFSPHNLAIFNDRKFVDGHFASEMIRRYYGLLPWWRLDGVPVSYRIGIEGAARYLWSPNPHLLKDLIRDGVHPYEGGFLSSRAVLLDEARFQLVVERHFSVPEGQRVTSHAQEAHLRRLVSALVGDGRTVVLVATPVHPRYEAAVPAELMGRFEIVWGELLSLRGVVGLDLRDMPLERDQFRDWDHMNDSGAEVVTRALFELIREL